MKVFLDTNVVIDFLVKREGFFEAASLIMEMQRKGMIDAAISALTIVNCAYILRKVFSKEVMLEKVRWLCRSFVVTSVDRNALVDAARLMPRDVEDAVQYVSALQHGPDVIITRDETGFRDFGIRVMTPAAFIEMCRR